MRWLIVFLTCLSPWAQADQVQVAVAANFAAPARALSAAFGRQAGPQTVLITGSTGKFYAQIRSGAPFDVLLSGDAETPARLEAEGLGVAGTRFPYALGRLVLWSASPGLVDERGDVLRSSFRRLAIANPRVAPYGLAAQQVLEKLGLWQAVQERLVLGENIAQTFQFTASGSAEIGFVAYSQVNAPGKAVEGSRWVVSRSLHAPIRQDAILLQRGSENAAARQFLDFLRTPAARDVIRSYGYDLP